jgi:hypothetical protein
MSALSRRTMSNVDFEYRRAARRRVKATSTGNDRSPVALRIDSVARSFGNG